MDTLSKENTAVNNVDSPLLELTWKLEKFKFSKVRINESSNY